MRLHKPVSLLETTYNQHRKLYSQASFRKTSPPPLQEVEERQSYQDTQIFQNANRKNKVLRLSTSIVVNTQSDALASPQRQQVPQFTFTKSASTNTQQPPSLKKWAQDRSASELGLINDEYIRECFQCMRQFEARLSADERQVFGNLTRALSEVLFEPKGLQSYYRLYHVLKAQSDQQALQSEREIRRLREELKENTGKAREMHSKMERFDSVEETLSAQVASLQLQLNALLETVTNLQEQNAVLLERKNKAEHEYEDLKLIQEKQAMEVHLQNEALKTIKEEKKSQDKLVQQLNEQLRLGSYRINQEFKQQTQRIEELLRQSEKEK